MPITHPPIRVIALILVATAVIVQLVELVVPPARPTLMGLCLLVLNVTGAVFAVRCP